MLPRWLIRPVVALALCGLLTPAVVSAVTVEQVVELSKAGVSEAVLLALIDRDRTVLTIDAAQILALHRDGLTDRIIVAMLKSGRQEGEDAARADAALNAQTIAAALSPSPEVAYVGHGPDVPNTAHSSNFSDPLIPGVIPVPYAAVHIAPSLRRRATPVSQAPRARGAESPALCVARVTPAGSASSLAMITQCPAVMQRSTPR
jgi:hypothetical protein